MYLDRDGSKTKTCLFGLFYRPPNSDANYLSAIENSIYLAVDTGIRDIILTGNFNFDMQKTHTAIKSGDFCLEFSLTEVINEPSHFTETSS